MPVEWVSQQRPCSEHGSLSTFQRASLWICHNLLFTLLPSAPCTVVSKKTTTPKKIKGAETTQLLVFKVSNKYGMWWSARCSKMPLTSQWTGAFNTALGPRFRSRRRETYFKGFPRVSNGQAVTPTMQLIFTATKAAMTQKDEMDVLLWCFQQQIYTQTDQKLQTHQREISTKWYGDIFQLFLRYACVVVVFLFCFFGCRENQVSPTGN